MGRRYDDGEFVENEPSRRALRDEYRDAFFGGGERLKDPFDFDPDPAAQLSAVVGLLDKAMSIHTDDTSAIASAKSSVAGSVLGVGSLGLPLAKLGRPNLAQVSVPQMATSHFNHWVGWDEPGPDGAN